MHYPVAESRIWNDKGTITNNDNNDNNINNNGEVKKIKKCEFNPASLFPENCQVIHSCYYSDESVESVWWHSLTDLCRHMASLSHNWLTSLLCYRNPSEL